MPEVTEVEQHCLELAIMPAPSRPLSPPLASLRSGAGLPFADGPFGEDA